MYKIKLYVVGHDGRFCVKPHSKYCERYVDRYCAVNPIKTRLLACTVVAFSITANKQQKLTEIIENVNPNNHPAHQIPTVCFV